MDSSQPARTITVKSPAWKAPLRVHYPDGTRPTWRTLLTRRVLGIPPHTYGTTPPPATANPATPPEDSTTPELARLRRQHAELHARHRELKRTLIALLLTATHDTCGPG